MNDLPAEMVAAWLREDDNVTRASGSPSWASLTNALKKTGHGGLAAKIRACLGRKCIMSKHPHLV